MIKNVGETEFPEGVIQQNRIFLKRKYPVYDKPSFRLISPRYIIRNTSTKTPKIYSK